MMHLQEMREVIKRSREVLANNPVPDGFAGRKTQEPFPLPDEDRTYRWENSKELEPPK